MDTWELERRCHMEEKEAFIEPIVEVVALEGDVICTSGCPDELQTIQV